MLHLFTCYILARYHRLPGCYVVNVHVCRGNLAAHLVQRVLTLAGVAMVYTAVAHRIVALHYTNAEAEGHIFCMLMLWFDQVYTTAVAEGSHVRPCSTRACTALVSSDTTTSGVSSVDRHDAELS
jgi:drug/metabolite transporter superfamily protein YnfA